MPRHADFADANERHWEDAERFYKENRWANAEYLYGLSAECGLKAVMVVVGLKTDGRGSPGLAYRRHVHELWEPFIAWFGMFAWTEAFAKADYLRWMMDYKPFEDWSHHDRYAKRSRFREVNVKPHREATEKVRSMVWYAKMGGEKP